MGPDGEIIRLSLWDPAVDTEDDTIMNDVPQGYGNQSITQFYIKPNQLNTGHRHAHTGFALTTLKLLLDVILTMYYQGYYVIKM